MVRHRRNGRAVEPSRAAGDARPRAARVILTRDGRERQGDGGALLLRGIVRLRACPGRLLPQP
ncbi:hypothetical protein CFB84_23520 [Burkholderia aenigmatica]|uniref:Uncharacterized protein n=1 Tax=Burkholderia aenigmatica TaxID=2015348 RepID=A0A228IIH7_9BURK|nr:hypothetical protein HR51_08700 [Burkholderia cepacia]OXI42207.1 hypothetical protein CFB84_23520 [Burkholderia aenigmatica]